MSTSRIHQACLGLVLVALVISLVGLAQAPAKADVQPLPPEAIVDAQGSRAAGWTLTLAGGEQVRVGSLHAELTSCRADHPTRRDRRKCAAIVRWQMGLYVEARAARRAGVNQ